MESSSNCCFLCMYCFFSMHLSKHEQLASWSTTSTGVWTVVKEWMAISQVPVCTLNILCHVKNDVYPLHSGSSWVQPDNLHMCKNVYFTSSWSIYYFLLQLLQLKSPLLLLVFDTYQLLWSIYCLGSYFIRCLYLQMYCRFYRSYALI